MYLKSTSRMFYAQRAILWGIFFPVILMRTGIDIPYLFEKTGLEVSDFINYSVNCYSNRATTREFWRDTEAEEALVSD